MPAARLPLTLEGCDLRLHILLWHPCAVEAVWHALRQRHTRERLGRHRLSVQHHKLRRAAGLIVHVRQQVAIVLACDSTSILYSLCRYDLSFPKRSSAQAHALCSVQHVSADFLDVINTQPFQTQLAIGTACMT